MKNIHVKLLTASTTIIAILLIINLFVRSSVPSYNKNDDAFFNQQNGVFPMPIPDFLEFADEKVPLKKTYVRESYDREILVNTYWHSQTILLIKRANRYFPVIEKILKEQQVPDDFKYLALIESGFLPRVVSPSGAAGIWQFLKGTAKEYNLEVSNEVDERYHLEKATVAACNYLKKAYNKYGSWTLAAAAYNAGFAGIDRQIAIQKTDNYYDLLLNEETARYVFRILALKQIFANPVEFGFNIYEKDLYQPLQYYEVEINDAVNDFADFAKEHGVTYRELKDLNPWLREAYLKNPNRKNYTIKIPKPETFIFEEN